MTQEESIPGWGPIKINLKVGDRVQHGYRDTSGTITEVKPGVGKAAFGRVLKIGDPIPWPVDQARVKWDRGTIPVYITPLGEGTEWLRV